jgi:hypothetical protein
MTESHEVTVLDFESDSNQRYGSKDSTIPNYDDGDGNFQDNEGRFMEESADSDMTAAPTARKPRRLLLVVGAVILISVAVAVAVTMMGEGANSQTQPDQILSAAEDTSNNTALSQSCLDAKNGWVQDTKTSELQIRFVSDPSMNQTFINFTDALRLEEAVQVGYNRVTGTGCNDTEFGRWMFFATMVHQELTLVEAAISEQATVLTATFETGISCSGCQDETSFATVYPDTFDVHLNETMATDSYDDGRRILRHDFPSYQNLDGRTLQDAYLLLNAGNIMTSIAQAIHDVLGAKLGPVNEAAIKARSDGATDQEYFEMTSNIVVDSTNRGKGKKKLGNDVVKRSKRSKSEKVRIGEPINAL